MKISPALRQILDTSPYDLLTGIKRKINVLGIKSSMLTKEQEELLAQMRQDNSIAPSPFRATEFWTRMEKMFDAYFYSQSINNIEEKDFNMWFHGFKPGDHRIYDYFVWTYFQLLRQKDKYNLLQKIPATCSVGKGLAYEIDGCKLSLDLMFSIDEFYCLLELRPDLISEPLIVSEIGAGWGRLGYVIKCVNPKAIYAAFDLPEILLISSTYLPKLLDQFTAREYQESRKFEVIDREALKQSDLWFFGSQDFQKVEPETFDLVVNIASFQEMTLLQVAEYLEHIDEKLVNSGGLFLKQLWNGDEHNPTEKTITGYEAYPFPKHFSKAFLRNTLWSTYFFEAGFKKEEFKADSTIEKE